MYYSTRNKNEIVSPSKALINGLASDGGLYLIDKIPQYNMNKDTLTKDYKSLAKDILALYFDDFTKEEISYCVDKAYNKENFEEKIVGVKSFDHYSFLELFYGPTLAFKDMALTLLPHLMEIAMKHEGIDQIKIITATSGDTGSAALSGFSKAKNISINVLYPHTGISKIQEKQMLYFTNNKARAYSLENANFDDCQRLVKSCLNQKNPKVRLSSANSINIGRLVPQIVYYYYGYISLVNEGKIALGERIDVVVPSGNFGNILACYLAKSMGCPIERLICATNVNNVLEDFFKTYNYDANRKFYVTNSPSMDILVSSNLERLIALISNQEEVKKCYFSLANTKSFTLGENYRAGLKDFSAYSANEEETLASMKESFSKGYLIDPHTAVGYACYKKAKNKNYTLIASTASFYKFPLTVQKALSLKEQDELKLIDIISKESKTMIPPVLERTINNKTPKEVINDKEFVNILFKKPTYKIASPCSSANLGCGFDICGIAFKLYNEYQFEQASKDEVVGFSKEFDANNNLVLKSYRRVFEKYNLDYIPVKITLLKSDIPESRGLGSSASCITAGVVGANAILNNKFSKKELLKIMVELEGHPDNVAPAYLGNFIASFKEGEEYYSLVSKVSSNLHFFACIPEVKLSTALARSVLPKSISISDATYDGGRLIALPRALEEGNVDLLRIILKDKIHQPYRLPLIPDYEKIEEFASSNKLPFAISGAGSTLLVISNTSATLEELKKIKTKVNYQYKELMVSSDGLILRKEF